MEMNKAVVADCLRRPMRLFQRTEEKSGDDNRAAGAGGGGSQPSKLSIHFQYMYA